MIWALLIAGLLHLTYALPDLGEAPKLTLDELVGAGTFAPPTAAPEAEKPFEIPLNADAAFPNPPKGLPLPVFDPTEKFEGPPPENENRDRFIEMPEGSFHIEFSKDNPPAAFNLSEPITIDLSKYANDKFTCGFCIKMAESLKAEISKKGIETFTEDLQKACQSQKDSVPAQAQTNCALIEKGKVEKLSSESAENICISEQRCKNQEEIAAGNEHMAKLAQETKEEDEMREKWKKENERSRQIVEAQEEMWRREFKRKHNDTMEPFKPFLVNLPEGTVEGSGIEDEDWKPDFDGWDVMNSTATSMDTTTVAVETSETATLSEGGEAEAEKEEVAEKKIESAAESAPGSKFKPLEATLPTVDFVHEVMEQPVAKADSVPASSTVAPEGGAEKEVEEEPAVVMAGPSMLAAVAGSTEAPTITAAPVDSATPRADEAGPEPTTLFSTTEASEQKDGEEQARRTLQSTILEAKKAVDEDVGFMSKPVVIPNRGGESWETGPRVNLHEFVSDHHLGTASSPKATVDAANVEKPAESASVEPTISPPVRAPVQCDPPKKSSQFSAHPTTGQSADAAHETAAAAAESEATKLEVAAEQEGPAKMAVAKSRPMRVVNRLVETQFSVDDIAK